MAGAGLLAQPVADAGEKAAEVAHEQWEKFSAGPALYVSNLLIKIGTIFIIGAGVSYIGAQATARQEQGFLNDIQNRLGQPQQGSPTPVKNATPPPPPLYQPQLQAATSAYNSLSPVSAKANLDALNTMLTNAQSLQAQANSQGAPSTVINDINGWVGIIAGAGAFMELAYTATIGTATEAPNLTIANQGWAAAKVALPDVALLTNQVAIDLGFPAPIPIGVASAPTIPWWEQAFATIGATVVGATQATVNDVSGIAQSVAQFAGDIGQALAFFAKAFMNAPQLLFDGLGYSVTWGFNTILTDLWPWLLALGVGALAVGCAIKFVFTVVWPHIQTRLELGAQARLSRWLGRFDAWFHTQEKVDQVWEFRGTESAIAAAAAEPVYVRSTTPLPSAPVPLKGNRAKAHQVKEPKVELPAEDVSKTPTEPMVGQTDDKTDAPEAPPSPPEEPAGPITPPPPETPAPPPPPPPETPVPTPTTETEDHLGEVPNRAPTMEQLAEMAAKAEAERRMTHPDPPPLPTYRQRKEELEREQADDLLKLANTFDDQYSAIRSEDDARKLADEQTTVIKEAQGNRRAAKAAARVLARKPVAERKYRGAMETANAGLRPEEYGA